MIFHIFLLEYNFTVDNPNHPFPRYRARSLLRNFFWQECIYISFKQTTDHMFP